MIKPPLSVKSCGICLWNLLAAGSGLLERLAKSKGLSSMCLTWNQHFAPHHTPPFATGVHSPFRSFQTSLWIESPYNIISLFVFLLTCTTYTMHITTRCISALPRNAQNSLHSEEPSTLCRITQASPALTVGVAASLGWWGWSPEGLSHHGCHPQATTRGRSLGEGSLTRLAHLARQESDGILHARSGNKNREYDWCSMM